MTDNFSFGNSDKLPGSVALFLQQNFNKNFILRVKIMVCLLFTRQP